jgi:hypothetical protein
VVSKLGGAFGGEFRYEAYDDYRPPYAGSNPAGSGLDLTSNDFLGFSPNSDTHGNRHVTSLYAEAVAPIVGRNFTLPLVQSLELSASARYESYTDFGEDHEAEVRHQLAAVPLGDVPRLVQRGLPCAQSGPALHGHADPYRYGQHRHVPQHGDRSVDRRSFQSPQRCVWSNT